MQAQRFKELEPGVWKSYDEHYIAKEKWTITFHSPIKIKKGPVFATQEHWDKYKSIWFRIKKLFNQ